MIPKRTAQSIADKKDAYDIATFRDMECVRCHRGVPNRHHRQGRDRYNSIPSNLILLCGSGTTGCHSWAHTHPADARAHGFIVSSYIAVEEICEIPVLMWRRVDGLVMKRTWALLDDDGGVTWIGPREARERMERYGIEAVSA